MHITIKTVELLKHFKIRKLLQHVSVTKKPSSGSQRQYLAKITHLVRCGYVELIRDVISVMAAYYDL